MAIDFLFNFALCRFRLLPKRLCRSLGRDEDVVLPLLDEEEEGEEAEDDEQDISSWKPTPSLPPGKLYDDGDRYGDDETV